MQFESSSSRPLLLPAWVRLGSFCSICSLPVPFGSFCSLLIRRVPRFPPGFDFLALRPIPLHRFGSAPPPTEVGRFAFPCTVSLTSPMLGLIPCRRRLRFVCRLLPIRPKSDGSFLSALSTYRSRGIPRSDLLPFSGCSVALRFPPSLITGSGRCVFHHLHSSQRVVHFASLAIGSAPLSLSDRVGFPLGPLPLSTRLTTAVTAINSCVTIELSTEVDSSQV